MADVFAQFGAWAKAHRTGVLAGGGAGVAGLAYVVSRRNRTGGADPGTLGNVQPTAVDSAQIPGMGISAPEAFGMLLNQQSAFQSAVQGELDNRDRLNVARLSAALKARRTQQQQEARQALSWFARRYPARRPVPAPPRPLPPRLRPGVQQLIEQRRAALQRVAGGIIAQPGTTTAAK